MKRDFKHDKKYFNRLEFEQACLLRKCNPQMALVKLAQYIEKYPEDYSAYHEYLNVLILLGKFDEAENMIENLEKIVDDNSHFANFFSKLQRIKEIIILDKIKLFSWQERYHELYQLFLNYHDYLESRGLSHVEFYCKNKLGMIDKKREEIGGYIFKQMVEYSESDFREHVKKHDSSSVLDFDFDEGKISSCVFGPDFPLNQVIDEIKNNIFLENRLCHNFYSNIYVFKYNECGRADNKLTDYLKVVCFNNTKDIITLYPALKCENLPFVDLNYLVDKKDDKNKVKSKRMSQIDKFNKKYNFN